MLLLLVVSGELLSQFGMPLNNDENPPNQ